MTQSRRVSESRPTHQSVRSALRVLGMVHELHKVGYQLLRILPALSGSGYWRCAVTFRDNMEGDGYTIREFDTDRGLVAAYSSAQGQECFGWPDAAKMNSRTLANTFIERFPKMTGLGLGRDWAYAGWLSEVLGKAEAGTTDDLLYLAADYGPDRWTLEHWSPPRLDAQGMRN